MLHDRGATVRNAYSLTHAVSPYPRDYIIDQNGILRFTSTEYRPQTMISVIESLLGTTSVENEHEAPHGFTLQQNYPNPFNQSTTIRFTVPYDADVDISVYNVNGSRVASVARDRFSSGEHDIRWDGRDDRGIECPSGLYFIRLRTENSTIVRKASILR